MSIPNTLGDIITKVRRVTARPSSTQISDQEIIRYVNTFYIYDMPEHLKLANLRCNYQFVTTPNRPVYDFPTDLYLTDMPPVFIAGYQSYMTQSRENFFRINSTLNFLQTASLSRPTLSENLGNAVGGAFAGNVSQFPVFPSSVLIAVGSITFVDNGVGVLVGIPGTNSGTINYATGAITLIFVPALGVATAVNVTYKTVAFSLTLTNVPIIPGFKPNPPGAYSATPIQSRFLNWNVLVSTQGAPDNTTGIQPYFCLVDDGLGHLVSPFDPASSPVVHGTINYITGVVYITGFVTNDSSQSAVSIPSGNPINVQYIPYVASRPQSVVFYQDQMILYPVPDQAYTVSFETYKYPASFTIAADGTFNASLTPQLTEWWQLLAYGAADKIFADNADFENMQKFRPLLEEQMNLILRRTIVQQTSERVATIYTEQSQFPGYPFGNLFSGF